MKIRSAQPSDLTTIMAIEHAGFTPEEAASEAAMRERIAVISDSFLVATSDGGELLGYVVGPVSARRYIDDVLFEQVTANPAKGGFQTGLSLAVAPAAQHHQVGGQHLTALDR